MEESLLTFDNGLLLMLKWKNGKDRIGKEELKRAFPMYALPT